MQKEYDFGENEKLMDEVIEFAGSSNFLKGRFKSEITDDMVTDPEKILDITFGDYPGVNVGYMTWGDMLTNEFCSAYDHVVGTPYRTALEKEMDKYKKRLQDNVCDSLFSKEKVHDIGSDMFIDHFNYILEVRALHGTKNKFFEKVFDVYKQGGVICGFRGDLKNEDWVIFYNIREDIRPVSEIMSEFKEFDYESEIIKEVLDVIYRPKLITGMIESDEKNIVLTSFDEAWQISFDKKYNDNKDNWEELVSKETIKVGKKNRGSKYSKIIEDNVRHLGKDIDNVLLDSFDDAYDKAYNIVKDALYSVIYTRMSQGMSNRFFEELFWIYKNGGWPCGYQGDLEKGRFIAFYPTIIS